LFWIALENANKKVLKTNKTGKEVGLLLAQLKPGHPHKHADYQNIIDPPAVQWIMERRSIVATRSDE